MLFQPFEPAHKGCGSDYGVIEYVPLEHCEQMGREGGREARHVWGDLPPWCETLGGNPVMPQP